MQARAVDHYREDNEKDRLASPGGRLEFQRTIDLLARHLPPAPGDVADIGGGTGPYSLHLTGLGYRAHLIDFMPEHIEIARGLPLASAAVGDARKLPFADGSMDAALLMGPLYHLLDRSERVAALREAGRILRKGGLLFAVCISRFASALDGLASGHDADPVFRAIVLDDLATGQHRNPSNHPAYFTDAFLHRPNDLLAEVADAGFANPRLAMIEGPAWLYPHLDRYVDDAPRWSHLMDVLRRVEEEPSLIGSSAHIAAIATKP